MEKYKCENCYKIVEDVIIYEDGWICESCYDKFEPDYNEYLGPE